MEHITHNKKQKTKNHRTCSLCERCETGKKAIKKLFHVPCYMFHGEDGGERGFTLLEVIISIFILTVGTLTIVGLIADSLAVVGASKKIAIGTSLAQEGIEVVRNIRDTNWIEDGAYDDGLDIDDDYCVNYDSTALISCGSFDLFWDEINLNYSHSAGSSTGFSRTISILASTDSDGVDYIRVQSVVSWDTAQTTVETHLYDWK